MVIIVYRTSLDVPKVADVGLWELEARCINDSISGKRVHFYEQFMNFLFETYGFLYPMI
jgi:hypothetical protein